MVDVGDLPYFQNVISHERSATNWQSIPPSSLFTGHFFLRPPFFESPTDPPLSSRCASRPCRCPRRSPERCPGRVDVGCEQEVQKPPWVSQASVERSRQEDLGIMVLQQSGVYPQKNSKFVDGKWFNKFHKSSCFGDFRGTPSDKTQLALPPGFAQVRFAGLGKTT
jgi:hypothetical protein